MKREQKNRSRGGWWFLAAVLVLYGLVAQIQPSATAEAWGHFSQTLGQLLPMLGVVFILLLLVERFVARKRVVRLLGKTSGLRGWLLAILGGIVAAGPVYLWFGLAAELRSKGIRNGLLVAFLYSRAVKLPLLPLLVHYFGLAYTLVLTIYLILLALVGGLLAERFGRGQALNRSSVATVEGEKRSHTFSWKK